MGSSIKRLFSLILSSGPLVTVIFFLSVFIFAVAGFFAGRIIQKISDKNKIKSEREDAVKRSRAVLGGQFGEQIAPLLPDFPCNPGDVRFIGKPVDFVGFSGTAEGKEIKDIYFIEVKSGDSTLTQREKEIKDAVSMGRVHFVEYRIPE